MTIKRIESLTWLLIYGGMILFAIGVSLHSGDAATGWVVACVGVAATIAGAVLVYVRSRMRSDDV